MPIDSSDAQTRSKKRLHLPNDTVSTDGHHHRAVGPSLEDLGFYRTFVHSSTEGIWRLEMEEPISIALPEAKQIEQFFNSTYLAECNDSFARMNGFDTTQQILGLAVEELFDRENADNQALLHRMIQNGYQQTTATLSHQASNRERKWFNYTCYAVVEKNAVIRAWGTQQDITEQKRNEQIQAALYKITQASSSAQNLQELYQSIHQILGELMPADNLFIALYDPIADLIMFPYFIDEFDPAPDPNRPGRGLTEYVLRTGQPLLAGPEDFENLIRKGEVEQVGTRMIDWLGVPLIVQNNIIGVLAIQTYTEGVRYGKTERDLLGFVSNQVAMAIDRKRADETLRMNEARYRAIVEDQTEMICRFLPDTSLTFVNEAYCRYYGKKREELLGTSFTSLIPPEDRPNMIANLAAMTPANPSHIDEHRGIKAGGIITWEQWATRAIFNENGAIVEFQTVGRDITDRKKVEDELRYLSTHDRLTGIYNRAFFEEEMYRLQFGRQFPVSVLMADVDGLKETNDTYGHMAGDELLRQAADELRLAFRTQDVVARIGGDEFGILVPSADGDVAEKSIERIRANLENHNTTPGKVLIHLSLGYATATKGEELPGAYKQADAMMYQEKFQMRARRVQDILRGMKTEI